MTNMVLPLVLAMTAVCMLLIALFSALQGRMIRRGIREAEGQVVGYTPETPSSHARPMVSFVPQGGEQVIVPVQTTSRAARHASIGDHVAIQYAHSKVLGLDRWSVFIVSSHAQAKPWRIYTVMAGTLAGAAVILLVVGALLLLA